MNSRFLYGTIGHTAAGKTTLSNYMKDNPAFVFEYINEGEIKRGLVDAYSTTDSLNEELRDRSYRIAIEKAQSILLYHNVLIDASFHKLKRRNLIYKMLEKNKERIPIIWLYCYCPNLCKVHQRIEKRRHAQRIAENQADSIIIYNHIIAQFDYPSIANIPPVIKGAIIYINTDTNVIEKTETNSQSGELMTEVNRICKYIKNQQILWRKIN